MTEEDEEPEKDKTEYPVDPLEREAAGLPPLEAEGYREPDPPMEVRVGVWVALAAAAALALGFVLMIINVDDIAAANVAAYEEGIRTGDPTVRPDVTPDDVEAGAVGLAWLLGLGGVMTAVLVSLFAFRIRAGTRSARSVLIALVAVIAGWVLIMPGGYVNFAHWAALVLGVIAVISLYVPAANKYLPKLPQTRNRWRG